MLLSRLLTHYSQTEDQLRLVQCCVYVVEHMYLGAFKRQCSLVMQAIVHCRSLYEAHPTALQPPV
jgi:hypothetical protein